MGQEAEEEINFVCLRAIIDEAIKNKKIFAIEAMDAEKQEKELKYMQKYAELRVSKDVSLKSYRIGAYGIIFFAFTISLSYFLVSVSNNQKLLLLILSFIGLTIAILLSVWIVPIKIKQFENNIECIHKIILKIEEKLLNRN